MCEALSSKGFFTPKAPSFKGSIYMVLITIIKHIKLLRKSRETYQYVHFFYVNN